MRLATATRDLQAFFEPGAAPEQREGAFGWADVAAIVGIVLVGGGFLGHKLGAAVLMGWDESLYAEVARQMYVTGDYLHQRWNFADALDKPPLGEWATALAYSLFGVTPLGARAWSFACGIGTLVATFLLGRLLFDRWIGLAAALILSQSPLFQMLTRRGHLDTSYVFFAMLAMAAFWLISARPRHAVSAGIALGLAILSKGVFASLCLLTLAAYALLERPRPSITGRQFAVIVLAAAVVSIPWHALQTVIYGWRFIQEYLIWNIVSRASQDIIQGSWNLTFCQYLLSLFRDFRMFYLFIALGGVCCLWQAWKYRSGPALFLLVWGVVTAAITCCMKTRLASYLLFAYPAAALVGALGVSLFARSTRLAFLLVLALVLTILFFPKTHLPDVFVVPDLEALNPGMVRLAVAAKTYSRPEDVLLVRLPARYHIASTVFYSERKVIPARSIEEIKLCCASASQPVRQVAPGADIRSLHQAMLSATAVMNHYFSEHLLLPLAERPELQAWLSERGVFFCLVPKATADLLPKGQCRIVAADGPLVLLACGRGRFQVVFSRVNERDRE